MDLHSGNGWASSPDLVRRASITSEALAACVEGVTSVPLLDGEVCIAVGRLRLPPTADSASTPRAGVFGRGQTAAEAEAGCLGEVLESNGGTFRGDERLHQSPLRLLDGAVNPRDTLLFSARQYDDRERLNPMLPPRHAIPEPFNVDEPIDWVSGWRLDGQGVAWVPAACCFLDYRYPPGQRAFATADLTGCAAGATRTEAVLHALLECVERDAVALWWYNQARRPAIDLHTFSDPRIPRVRARLAQRGRSLIVLDTTTDVDIPTYVAIISLHDGRQPVFGAAAHPLPAVAAWKAVTEAVLHWYSIRYCVLPPDIAAWVSATCVEDYPYLTPDHERHAVTVPTGTADTYLRGCVEKLQAVGISPIAIDLTRDDGAPVVRVVAPGLRHVFDRRAAGRLYDVPPAIGWLTAPLTEAQLNRTPCTW